MLQVPPKKKRDLLTILSEIINTNEFQLKNIPNKHTRAGMSRPRFHICDIPPQGRLTEFSFLSQSFENEIFI